MKTITGSIVALATPLHPDGSVDYPSLRKLVDWHVAEGTDCIGVVGTTGESPTVNVEEHCEIIRVSVEQAAKRVPIMAGCGANSTAEAIELAKFARGVGADCQLQVVPYYNKPTQEGQYQHFKAIAEATGDLPCILYNVPGRTVADMLHATVLRLAQIPGIVGIKEATGNIERAQWLIKEAPKGFAVYSGDDATAVALMLCGGQGNVSVTANSCAWPLWRVTPGSPCNFRCNCCRCTKFCSWKPTPSPSNLQWREWGCAVPHCACR
jgi:4-hydroxy-tetrahydrodipicolinate synthase